MPENTTPDSTRRKRSAPNEGRDTAMVYLMVDRTGPDEQYARQVLASTTAENRIFYFYDQSTKKVSVINGPGNSFVPKQSLQLKIIGSGVSYDTDANSEKIKPRELARAINSVSLKISSMATLNRMVVHLNTKDKQVLKRIAVGFVEKRSLKIKGMDVKFVSSRIAGLEYQVFAGENYVLKQPDFPNSSKFYGITRLPESRAGHTFRNHRHQNKEDAVIGLEIEQRIQYKKRLESFINHLKTIKSENRIPDNYVPVIESLREKGNGWRMDFVEDGSDKKIKVSFKTNEIKKYSDFINTKYQSKQSYKGTTLSVLSTAATVKLIMNREAILIKVRDDKELSKPLYNTLRAHNFVHLGMEIQQGIEFLAQVERTVAYKKPSLIPRKLQNFRKYGKVGTNALGKASNVFAVTSLVLSITEYHLADNKQHKDVLAKRVSADTASLLYLIASKGHPKAVAVATLYYVLDALFDISGIFERMFISDAQKEEEYQKQLKKTKRAIKMLSSVYLDLNPFNFIKLANVSPQKNNECQGSTDSSFPLIKKESYIDFNKNITSEEPFAIPVNKINFNSGEIGYGQIQLAVTEYKLKGSDKQDASLAENHVKTTKHTDSIGKALRVLCKEEERLFSFNCENGTHTLGSDWFNNGYAYVMSFLPDYKLNFEFEKISEAPDIKNNGTKLLKAADIDYKKSGTARQYVTAFMSFECFWCFFVTGKKTIYRDYHQVLTKIDSPVFLDTEKEITLDDRDRTLEFPSSGDQSIDKKVLYQIKTAGNTKATYYFYIKGAARYDIAIPERSESTWIFYYNNGDYDFFNNDGTIANVNETIKESNIQLGDASITFNDTYPSVSNDKLSNLVKYKIYVHDRRSFFNFNYGKPVIILLKSSVNFYNTKARVDEFKKLISKYSVGKRYFYTELSNCTVGCLNNVNDPGCFQYSKIDVKNKFSGPTGSTLKRVNLFYDKVSDKELVVVTSPDKESGISFSSVTPLSVVLSNGKFFYEKQSKTVYFEQRQVTEYQEFDFSIPSIYFGTPVYLIGDYSGNDKEELRVKDESGLYMELSLSKQGVIQSEVYRIVSDEENIVPLIDKVEVFKETLRVIPVEIESGTKKGEVVAAGFYDRISNWLITYFNSFFDFYRKDKMDEKCCELNSNRSCLLNFDNNLNQYNFSRGGLNDSNVTYSEKCVKFSDHSSGELSVDSGGNVSLVINGDAYKDLKIDHAPVTAFEQDGYIKYVSMNKHTQNLYYIRVDKSVRGSESGLIRLSSPDFFVITYNNATQTSSVRNTGIFKGAIPFENGTLVYTVDHAIIEIPHTAFLHTITIGTKQPAEYYSYHQWETESTAKLIPKDKSRLSFAKFVSASGILLQGIDFGLIIDKVLPEIEDHFKKSSVWNRDIAETFINKLKDELDAVYQSFIKRFAGHVPNFIQLIKGDQLEKDSRFNFMLDKKFFYSVGEKAIFAINENDDIKIVDDDDKMFFAKSDSGSHTQTYRIPFDPYQCSESARLAFFSTIHPSLIDPATPAPSPVTGSVPSTTTPQVEETVITDDAKTLFAKKVAQTLVKAGEIAGKDAVSGGKEFVKLTGKLGKKVADGTGIKQKHVVDTGESIAKGGVKGVTKTVKVFKNIFGRRKRSIAQADDKLANATVFKDFISLPCAYSDSMPVTRYTWDADEEAWEGSLNGYDFLFSESKKAITGLSIERKHLELSAHTVWGFRDENSWVDNVFSLQVALYHVLGRGRDSLFKSYSVKPWLTIAFPASGSGFTTGWFAHSLSLITACPVGEDIDSVIPIGSKYYGTFNGAKTNDKIIIDFRTLLHLRKKNKLQLMYFDKVKDAGDVSSVEYSDKNLRLKGTFDNDVFNIEDYILTWVYTDPIKYLDEGFVSSNDFFIYINGNGGEDQYTINDEALRFFKKIIIFTSIRDSGKSARLSRSTIRLRLPSALYQAQRDDKDITLFNRFDNNMGIVTIKNVWQGKYDELTNPASIEFSDITVTIEEIAKVVADHGGFFRIPLMPGERTGAEINFTVSPTKDNPLLIHFSQTNSVTSRVFEKNLLLSFKNTRMNVTIENYKFGSGAVLYSARGIPDAVYTPLFKVSPEDIVVDFNKNEGEAQWKIRYNPFVIRQGYFDHYDNIGVNILFADTKGRLTYRALPFRKNKIRFVNKNLSWRIEGDGYSQILGSLNKSFHNFGLLAVGINNLLSKAISTDGVILSSPGDNIPAKPLTLLEWAEDLSYFASVVTLPNRDNILQGNRLNNVISFTPEEGKRKVIVFPHGGDDLVIIQKPEAKSTIDYRPFLSCKAGGLSCRTKRPVKINIFGTEGNNIFVVNSGYPVTIIGYRSINQNTYNTVIVSSVSRVDLLSEYRVNLVMKDITPGDLEWSSYRIESSGSSYTKVPNQSLSQAARSDLSEYIVQFALSENYRPLLAIKASAIRSIVFNSGERARDPVSWLAGMSDLEKCYSEDSSGSTCEVDAISDIADSARKMVSRSMATEANQKGGEVRSSGRHQVHEQLTKLIQDMSTFKKVASVTSTLASTTTINPSATILTSPQMSTTSLL
ncbi:hypothetical protein [Endozoicomonas euniceicola]|uniref:Uncharacterized protein n=1 Tax=Endozoicomonas euniceicola TaxID=1234143 RepID=A0ABY6GS34_9GAMM|nr:hypothetical protein [Endozoicomonas euniceicola]UYM15561.1 hypothetical protein NX720_22405 [Endozoicomonas euniceicola]